MENKLLTQVRRKRMRGATVYAPSHDVFKEMTVTQMGLWIDRCGRRGRDITLVLKCPTHVCKSLRNGSPVQLLLADIPGRYASVRCLGFQIEDRIGKPLTTFCACRTRDEQQLLVRAFQRKELPLFIFDEIERCVANCIAVFDPEGRDAVNAALIEWPSPYAGRFCSVVELALDKFNLMLEDAFRSDGLGGAITVDCSLSEWNLTSIYGIGSGDFRLDGDDGGGLEQTTHQLLESLFKEDAFRSPNLQQTNGKRELIDSLLIGDHVICLVESKAIGFMNDSNSLDSDQLAKRVRKDVDKGLRQLRGATRAVRNGKPISEIHQDIAALARNANVRIVIPDCEWVVLGVVVISDLGCDVDWHEVAGEYLAASSEDALFQVVDLTELRALVGAAKNRMQFVTNLILRWKQVEQLGSMGVRVRIRRKSSE